MTRICHLIDTNIATRYFSSIATHHDHERFPVMIGSIAPEGTLQRSMVEVDVPTFSLGVGDRKGYPVALFRLVRLLRQQQVSVVHAHCFEATALGLAASRLAGTRFVFTRHYLDHHVRLGKRWHVRIDAGCARRADRVIAISEAVRHQLVAVERVPSSNVTLVHNGIEPLPPPSDAQIDALRTELGLERQPVCLVIARLHEEKGHRFLFEAIPRVAAEIGPVTYVLVGDGPLREEFEADMRRRGLGDTVRILGWRNDIPELVGAASVLALPSVAEPFGFALVEAMSLGVPVVATAAGGATEIVADGVDGLLVPPRDPAALAGALFRVLSNPGLAAALGAAGRDSSRRFSFERMMKGYEAVYAEILRLDVKEAARARPPE